MSGIGGAVGCSQQTSDRDIRYASLAEVQTLVEAGRPQAALLIDTRPPGEFAAGHIPGARNMPLTAVGEQARIDPELERYGQLIVYGNDPGTASAPAMTKRLMNIGYRNVRLFVGGVSEWRRAGLALRKQGE